MKFAIVGDIHLTDKQPKNRKDHFVTTQKEKFVSILNQAQAMECEAVLCPGDFFDSHTASDKLKTDWITFLKSSPELPNIVMVTGQHDLRYHSSPIDNTPTGVLNASKVLTVLNKDCPAVFPSVPVYIYGAGWNKEIPKIEFDRGVSILLTHRMVVNEKELWPGQEEFERANYLLRTTKFDLIVTGDNHQSFHYSIGKDKKRRWLINCGSLMRKNIDQANHKPCFWVYDTETKEASQHFLSIQPFENVYDLTVAKEEKEKDEKLEAFVKKLGDSGKKGKISGLKFKKNLIAKIKANEEHIHEETKNIIDEIMGGLNA